MLTFNEVQNFFETNKILLKQPSDFSNDEVERIYSRARDKGYSFYAFIYYSVIVPEKTGSSIYFDSFDELYHCYTEFLIGLLNYKA